MLRLGEPQRGDIVTFSSPRYIGLVPRHLLIGKAARVLVSLDILGLWLPRLERFGQALV